MKKLKIEISQFVLEKNCFSQVPKLATLHKYVNKTKSKNGFENYLLSS